MLMCLSPICLAAPVVLAQGAAKTQPNSEVVCAAAPTPVGAAADGLAAALQDHRTGKFDEAIGTYNGVIAGGDPAAAPYAYAGLARAYLKQHKISEAYDAASKANALTPNAAPAIVALGEVYFRQGRLVDAERAFRAPCIADARAYLGLSRIYLIVSNFKSARSALHAAQTLDPSDPDIRSAWAAAPVAGDRRIYLPAETGQPKGKEEDSKSQSVVLSEEKDASNGPCRVVTKATGTEVKFDPVGSQYPSFLSGYGLPVKLNGTSANLQMDTGASGIVVERKMAKKAGIKLAGREELQGIGDKGPAGSSVGLVDSIKIGDLEFKSCYVDIVDQKSGLEDDGLIGADVFEDFLVELNFPDVKFKLSPLPPLPDQPTAQASLQSGGSGAAYLRDRYTPPAMKSYTPVLRFGHSLVIPTSVNGTPAKLFLIDTGAFADTISPAAAKEVTRIVREDNLTVKGLSGEVSKVFSADSVSLTFSHLQTVRQRLVTFDLTNLSDMYSTEISGILGFATLRLIDIKIDYRDALVDFEYDPHRFH
jgi:tetratricopeptide (TPR) repeat protein